MGAPRLLRLVEATRSFLEDTSDNNSHFLNTEEGKGISGRRNGRGACRREVTRVVGKMALELGEKVSEGSPRGGGWKAGLESEGQVRCYSGSTQALCPTQLPP